MTDLIKTDSRYLHGDDLRKGNSPCEVTLTIKSVGDRDSAKSQTGQTIAGYPVEFEETPKVLVLNNTNTKLAVAALGTNSRAEWVGKRLTIYPAVLAECFGQRDVVCVRVRVPKGRPKPFVMPKHLGKDITQVSTQRRQKPPETPQETKEIQPDDADEFERQNPVQAEIDGLTGDEYDQPF